MKRVRIFYNSTYYIEKDVDAWLDHNPGFEIVSVTSCLRDNGDVLLTIVYDDGTLPKFETIK